MNVDYSTTRQRETEILVPLKSNFRIYTRTRFGERSKLKSGIFFFYNS